MKEKIIILGHVDHGKSTLSSALQKVIDEEIIMAKNQFQEPIPIRNYHSVLNEKTVSKTTLKKCEKGLHEYKSESVKVSESLIEKRLVCINCGISIR